MFLLSKVKALKVMIYGYLTVAFGLGISTSSLLPEGWQIPVGLALTLLGFAVGVITGRKLSNPDN